MAKLGRLRDKKTGETIYPATITDGVVNPVNRRKLTEELQLLSQNKANKTEVVSNTTFTTEMAKKQEKLVSGTNIKTINGQTLLEEGDMKIVTTVDKELSGTSENPVQNKVVKANLDTLKGDLGDKSQLTTSEKSSLVGAINEVSAVVGSVDASLTTLLGKEVTA